MRDQVAVDGRRRGGRGREQRGAEHPLRLRAARARDGACDLRPRPGRPGQAGVPEHGDLGAAQLHHRGGGPEGRLAAVEVPRPGLPDLQPQPDLELHPAPRPAAAAHDAALDDRGQPDLRAAIDGELPTPSPVHLADATHTSLGGGLSWRRAGRVRSGGQPVGSVFSPNELSVYELLLLWADNILNTRSVKSFCISIPTTPRSMPIL